MKLIFIHGRAQEHLEAASLKQEWIDTWKIGLSKSGLDIPANIQIEFPYYGKLLIDLMNKAKLEPLEKDSKRGSFLFDSHKENEFLTALLGNIAMSAAKNNAEKRAVATIIDSNRGLLNGEMAQQLLVWLDKKGNKQNGFAEALLKRFSKDVFAYLTNISIQNGINTHIKNVFTNEPCVVVGHSLGSIVSYLVLKANSSFQVKKLITIGSPLGYHSLRPYLQEPLIMPQCIQNGWFNAYDDGDYVALNPLDKVHFNINPEIENKKDVRNLTSNRHGIKGYLNDSEVAKKIYEALIG